MEQDDVVFGTDFSDETVSTVYIAFARLMHHCYAGGNAHFWIPEYVAFNTYRRERLLMGEAAVSGNS